VNNDRNWTVLFIGGASGTGKSSIAYEIARFYGVNETDINQILQNYLSREGGDLQHYRAEISVAYGKWIADTCNQNGIRVIESRPWDTILARALKSLF